MRFLLIFVVLSCGCGNICLDAKTKAAIAGCNLGCVESALSCVNVLKKLGEETGVPATSIIINEMCIVSQGECETACKNINDLEKYQDKIKTDERYKLWRKNEKTGIHPIGIQFRAY